MLLIDFDYCAISCRFGQLVTEIDKYLWEEEAHMRRVLGGREGYRQRLCSGEDNNSTSRFNLNLN